MAISQILVVFITITGLLHGGKQDPDFNCQAAIEKLTNIIVEMNSTLQKTGEEKLSKISHTITKRQVPETPIAFFAASSKDTLLGDGQTIIFDKVTTNEGSAYDKYDGQFTAPVSGLYFFSASIMAYPSHYIHAHIARNAMDLVPVFAAKGAYGLEDDTGTAVLNVVLQKGDKVWVRHGRDPGDAAFLEPEYSTFSGFLIQEM